MNNIFEVGRRDETPDTLCTGFPLRSNRSRPYIPTLKTFLLNQSHIPVWFWFQREFNRTACPNYELSVLIYCN